MAKCDVDHLIYYASLLLYTHRQGEHLKENIMLKFTKRFAGSYFAMGSKGNEINVLSMGQYTTEVDQDELGNKWVAYSQEDFGATFEKFKTKKDAVEYANRVLN